MWSSWDFIVSFRRYIKNRILSNSCFYSPIVQWTTVSVYKYISILTNDYDIRFREKRPKNVRLDTLSLLVLVRKETILEYEGGPFVPQVHTCINTGS